MIRICPLLKGKTNPQADIETFKNVISTGFNGVRFNFSHIGNDTANSYKSFLDKHFPDALKIQDLQGHKIRIGNIETACINKDENFLIVPNGYNSPNRFVQQIPLAFESYELLKDTKCFIVENKNNTSRITVLETINENGHLLFSCKSDSRIILRREKGIGAIGFDRTKLTMSQKDKNDVLWGIKNKADIIIYSFASSAQQIVEFKEYIKSKSEYMPKIWAKIESQEGVKNIKEILDEVDGIMIGRGDMCVEFNIEDIPLIQSELISLCKDKNKECVVATYLFDGFNSKNKPHISDITSMYYAHKEGATGFMPANELLFANDQVALAKAFNDYINKLEKYDV